MDSALLLPVRRLHNFLYCPRLLYLQWVEGLFQESADTARGDHVHRGVDRPDRWREEAFPEARDWRSVEVASHRLGLHGVIDLVARGETGVVVVDYKAGAPHRGADGHWVAAANDAAQIVAYAMLLEEQGEFVERGVVWYAAARIAVEVDLGESARAACLAAVAEARAVAETPQCPPPLTADPRCARCSALPLCLPDESRFWAEGGSPPDLERRPPRPDGDEGETLVVQDYRASVSLRGGEIRVQHGESVAARLPIEQVRAVYLYGSIQVSAPALTALMERGVAVAWFSGAGRFLGMAHGLSASGVDARRGQYRKFEDPSVRTRLIKEVLRGKISNQRVMMMRNGDSPPDVVERLAELRDACAACDDEAQLRGYEGAAAAAYFAHFGTMIRRDLRADFDWNGRNRRPPKDPLNALLSLGYSVLAKELAGIAQVVGLDPFLGFFHQPRYGRPALALDLMEEFRPLIADSVAVSLVNRGEVDEGDFVRTSRGVVLGDGGRKAFWKAWTRRMEQEVSHPEFGYRMSYRRMLDVQMRQMWRFCRDEASSYHAFTTR